VTGDEACYETKGIRLVTTEAEVSWRILLDKAVKEPGTISKAYSAFYGYSLGNQLLALGQCVSRGIALGPIATFMGWKEKGRNVKKGEKALTLCMPVTCKRKETDSAGQEVEAATFTRFIFKPRWFVLAQTEGLDVPVTEIPDWNREQALKALDIQELEFAELDGNVQGYAIRRAISISPVAGLPHKTRFHEMAHIVLGHTLESEMLNTGDMTPRDIREVEAECVALICLEVLQLPGTIEARGYVQHWNQGNTAINDKSAQRILKAADVILKAGRAMVEKTGRSD
jgi:antirestriction protein ArdC